MERADRHSFFLEIFLKRTILWCAVSCSALTLAACSNEIAPYHSYRMLGLQNAAERHAAEARKANEEITRANQSLDQTVEQIRLAANKCQCSTSSTEIKSIVRKAPEKKKFVARGH